MANAQCYLDRHNSSRESQWSSCSPSLNPNQDNGMGHWIMYDFGQEYPLYQLHYWNYNHPEDLDRGLQTVKIEVSEDQNTWIDMGTHTFVQANGSGFYEGEDGPDLGGIQARYLLITALSNYGDSQCFGLGELRVGLESTQAPEVVLNIRAKLSGAYNPANGLMNDQLRSKGLLPLEEPYTDKASFVHTDRGGGEQVSDASVFDNASPEDDIVDWVFIELRDANDINLVVQSKSALIQRDGDVVDIDGVSPLRMVAESTDYFVSIRHRNHLGVMAGEKARLNGITPTVIDFTSNPNYVLGRDLFEFSDGTYGMYGANVNGENVNVAASKNVRMTGPASINDYASLMLELGGNFLTLLTNEYSDADINMDGNVRMTGPASINDYAKFMSILDGNFLTLKTQSF